MTLDARELLRILPHRYPFLLVDRILELEPGKRAVGLKSVTLNEWFFPGHFPGHPIMPGVLVLEMMAQVAGVMMLTVQDRQDRLPYLSGVEKVRFRRPVSPGDTIRAELTMLRMRGQFGWARGEASVDGQIICDAELSCALVARDEAR